MDLRARLRRRVGALVVALLAAAVVGADAPSPATPGQRGDARDLGRLVRFEGASAASLASSLGVELPAGATLEVDPVFLVRGGAPLAGRELRQRREAETGRTAFLLVQGGPRALLADYTGDRRPEIAATTASGVAIVDGAKGVALGRTDDTALLHLGRHAGAEYVAGLGLEWGDGTVGACPPSSPPTPSGCEELVLTHGMQVVVRRAPTGAEAWRTWSGVQERHRNRSGSITGTSFGGSEVTRTQEPWEPLVDGAGRLHGHVTGRLEGTTRIQDDATGLAGTASGEGTAHVVRRDPVGRIVVERTIETGGPSHVRAVEDLTGDGVPDVVLLVGAWDAGAFACLPAEVGVDGPGLGGCLVPYAGAHLDALLLDGRDLTTVTTWRHAAPVDRGGGVWQAASVGDIDGDGAGDLVVSWSAFQDQRWSEGRQQQSAAVLRRDGAVVPIGRASGTNHLQQVVGRGAGARVVVGSLRASTGGGSDDHSGLVGSTLLPPPFGHDAPEPISVQAQWAYDVVELATSATVASGDFTLREEWGADQRRGDVAAVLGFAGGDLDGDPARDAVLGIGWARDGKWTSRTQWIGTGTSRVLYDHALPFERWRVPIVDLDLDGRVEALFASTGELGPRDAAPAAVWHGTTDKILWRRTGLRHGLAWTGDLDGQPGPDMLLYPGPDPRVVPNQTCLARGRTGEVVWCFVGD